MAAVDLDVLLYKVCSTFDSSPEIGSIGRGIELLHDQFTSHGAIPVAPAQPGFGRYTAFSNHYAAFAGDVYRLDRHPSPRHPSTPMHAADLRRASHRAAQRRRHRRLPPPPGYESGTFFDQWNDLRRDPASPRSSSMPSRSCTWTRSPARCAAPGDLATPTPWWSAPAGSWPPWPGPCPETLPAHPHTAGLGTGPGRQRVGFQCDRRPARGCDRPRLGGHPDPGGPAATITMTSWPPSTSRSPRPSAPAGTWWSTPPGINRRTTSCGPVDPAHLGTLMGALAGRMAAAALTRDIAVFGETPPATP